MFTTLLSILINKQIYQIDILPTDDEKRQFYEMLTAEELNMKVIDRDMEGQLSFGEDAQKSFTNIKIAREKLSFCFSTRNFVSSFPAPQAAGKVPPSVPYLP